MPIITKKMKTTRKKTKIVGKELYINNRTGAIEEMEVISIEERDANFHKIWLGHIIMSMDIIGNSKTKFVFWLIEQMTADNIIAMTYEQMAKDSGYSMETIKRTIPLLIQADFLIRINNGAYRVNPSVIFKGGKNERMNILLQYHKQAEDNENSEI